MSSSLRSRLRSRIRSNLRTKITLIVWFFTLLGSLLIAYISFTSTERLAVDSMGQIARSVIEQASRVIDIERYEQITLESGENEYYYELRNQLNQIRQSAGLTYLYTMSRRQTGDGYEYYYMVDGLPIGDENESLLGDREEEIEAYPGIVKTFDTGSSHAEISHSSIWGTSISAYIPICSASGEIIGIVAADIDITDVYQSMQKKRWLLVMTLLGISLVSCVLIFIYLYRLLKPLQSLKQQVMRIGEGDMTSRIDVQRQDEIGYLAQAISGMQDKLREMIGNILQAAESVSGQSTDLTKSSQEVKEANEQIAMTMEQLASGVDLEASELGRLKRDMQLFASRIGDVNEFGRELSGEATGIEALARQGAQLMDSSMRQMANINEMMKQSVDRIQQLNCQAEQISRLVLVIRSIADQTNLLALNASIEAVRAGEHGSGFAVVAGEVRKLADQVAQAAHDITTIVGSIQDDTQSMVTSLESGYAQVQVGSEQIDRTGSTLQQIQASISAVSDKLAAIAETIDGITQQSEDYAEAINKIAALSQETAAGVEEISASIEESNCSMEDVSRSADQLAKLAHTLRDQVKTFRIE